MNQNNALMTPQIVGEKSDDTQQTREEETQTAQKVAESEEEEEETTHQPRGVLGRIVDRFRRRGRGGRTTRPSNGSGNGSTNWRASPLW